MAVTEARQVLARGVEVILADGEPRLLRFDLDALEVIETDWGSLADFSRILVKAATAGFRTTRVKLVRSGLRAALSHLELSEAELSSLITFAQVRDPEVVKAIGEAWLEGVPMGGPAPGKASAEQSDSNGPSSIISAPSDSAAQTVSGAE